MARLSLVTGFTPGGKNAVTSLGHPSVMAYNLQDGKFTKNAFVLPCPSSALPGRISRDMLSAVQVRELPTNVKLGYHLLYCCPWLSAPLPLGRSQPASTSASWPLNLLPAAFRWGTEAFNSDMKE